MKNKIKIVKSFDKIKFDKLKKIEFEAVKEKFESEEILENRYELDYEYYF